MGMAQQSLWNREGLERARDAAARAGFRAVCDKKIKGGFDVTHDAGIMVIAWQLELIKCRF